ncbi:MAG TPA: 5'-methylthioadenosine/S-adenosylhomocysteine nucleosidase [Devosia sp.]|nr:5'-methylthioadenosine/S-adenosylhomocysteine nucleosidase [Devosia sp.]
MPFAHRRPGVPDLLYVMATPQEYGPALKSRISPLMTGVGPVEAAISLTLALAGLQAQDRLPQLVVSLGSAGSNRLAQLDIFQASEISYRDMDATALGFAPGETPFLNQPAVLRPGMVIPGIPQASLSTGANIVSGRAYDRIGSDMVDMESYAVLRACQHFSLPLVVLRGISDGAEELRELADWTRYLHIVDERLAAAVDLLEQAVSEGTLTTS